jgi:rRNA maturation protein Rpf1
MESAAKAPHKKTLRFMMNLVEWLENSMFARRKDGVMKVL